MIVNLILTKNKVFLDEETPRDIVSKIDDWTSAFVEGYKFSPKYKMRTKNGQRMWDGKVHLLSRATNSFPSGLLSFVCEKLEDDDYTVNLVTSEDYEDYISELPPEIQKDFWTEGFGGNFPAELGPFKFYDYQITAGETFLSPQEYQPYQGILKILTGGGKTAVAAGITKALGVQTLFVVHGRALVQQAYDVFVSCFGADKVGIITAKKQELKEITIASIDTLFSMTKKGMEEEIEEFIYNTKLLICDEVHRAPAKTFRTLISKIRAPFRLGLSGTPMKMQNDRDLVLTSLIGPILYEVGAEELQAKGRISHADLNVVVIDTPDAHGFDWQTAFQTAIVNNPTRTSVITSVASERALEGKQVLILAGNSVQYAHNLYNLLKDKVSTNLMTGSDSDDHVTECLSKFRNKELSILITTLLADEGVDLPDTNVLIIAAGGKSYVKTIQRIGRGIRKKTDNSALEVIDFFDNTNKYLSSHSSKRLKYYAAEKLFRTANTFTVAEIDKLCPNNQLAQTA